MKVYIGLDWSKEQHDVVFMNAAGVILKHLQVAQRQSGYAQFEQTRKALGVQPEECLIGIETAYNLLVDQLLNWGYTQLYILPPKAVNRGRDRFAQNPARTDRSDAALIADLVRTDQQRWSVWQSDGPVVQQLRLWVPMVLNQTRQITRINNQLEALLVRYYPAATQVFSKLAQTISLEFIKAFPTPQAAQKLSLADLRSFARQQHYTHMASLPVAYARLQADYPQAQPAFSQACADLVLLYVAQLEQALAIHKTSRRQLQALSQQHPDYPIYASLPGAGVLTEATLLAKLGDNRARFPEPHGLQALAGTCPYTVASGKYRKISFRHACDHKLRYVVQEWAGHTLVYSDWAALYYARARQRMGHNQALRALGNRWLAIVWRLWQNHTVYDPAYHLRQQAARAKPHLK